MRPQLEQNENYPFQLCLHERDFTPGNFILDNIQTAMVNSKYLIYAISHAFLCSPWCEYELKLGQTILLDEKKYIIILIFLQDIKKKDMPRTLRNLVYHVTYLNWPSTKRGQTVFWKRLKMSLGIEHAGAV